MVCDLPYAHELSGRTEILLQVSEQRPLLIVVTRGLLEDEIPHLEVDKSLFGRDYMLADLESAPIEGLGDVSARIASVLAETDMPDAEQAHQGDSTKIDDDISLERSPS